MRGWIRSPGPGASASAAGSEHGAPRGTVTGNEHFRELIGHTLGRLILLYFAPLLLLAVYFHLEYRQLLTTSTRAQLETTAEHHTRLFDLFLRERLVNLANVADDPAFVSGAAHREALRGFLLRLQQASDTFIDIGVVDSNGNLVGYAGPVRYPTGVNYHREEWFQELVSLRRRAVITDVYRGFRNRPHFTIAIQRQRRDGLQIVRAALSPERLAEYLGGLEGASDVESAIVNARGVPQVTNPRFGVASVAARFVPPREPWKGYVRGDGQPAYAYGWLTEAPWALVATPAAGAEGAAARAAAFLLPTLAVFLAFGIVVILIRSWQVARRQLATERREAELSGQLVHAARLAAVGELAAGIAHEINNPLAIIAEEVGELKDSMDPTLALPDEKPPDLGERLQAIDAAVFRCRDITHKLLGFVRQTEAPLERHCAHDILDDVLDTMLGSELLLSNVTVVRRYDVRPAAVLVDRNQLVQVFVNLVKNAIDAMPDGGTLTVTTDRRNGRVAVSIEDTGCGMTPDQLERVFRPFFTTKDPGKGTGLGLSVSYLIVQHFGGAFYVDSAPGMGSLFTVELPIAAECPPDGE